VPLTTGLAAVLVARVPTAALHGHHGHAHWTTRLAPAARPNRSAERHLPVPRSALRGKSSRPPGHPSQTGSRTVCTPRRTAPSEGDGDPVSCR